MKAAICTTDGSKVDLHFGKTSIFYIYEIEKDAKTLLEKRIVEKYSPSKEHLIESNISHIFDPKKLEFICNTISDCKKVYTVSIGEIPKQKLATKGIEVQLCNCPIELIPTCSGKCK